MLKNVSCYGLCLVLARWSIAWNSSSISEWVWLNMRLDLKWSIMSAQNPQSLTTQPRHCQNLRPRCVAWLSAQRLHPSFLTVSMMTWLQFCGMDSHGIGWMQCLRTGWMIDQSTFFLDAGRSQNRRTRHSWGRWYYSKIPSHYRYWFSRYPNQECPTCRHGYPSYKRQKNNESDFGCLARRQEARRLSSNNSQLDQQYGYWGDQGEENLEIPRLRDLRIS